MTTQVENFENLSKGCPESLRIKSLNMAKPSIIQGLKKKYGIKSDTLDRTITALAGII